MCEVCQQVRTSTSPPWCGRYSRTELLRACADLGVNRPVHVRAARKWEPWEFGEHYFNEDLGEHVITARYDLPREVANHTILHELAHAAQEEREPGTLMKSYWRENERVGYKDNAYEREADAIAKEMLPHYDIARDGR